MLLILQQLNLLEDTSVPARQVDMYLHGLVNTGRDLGVVVSVSELHANWVDKGISGMQTNKLIEGLAASSAGSISGMTQSADVVMASSGNSSAVVHGRYMEDEMVGVDSLLLNAESGVKTAIIAVDVTSASIGDK